MVRRYLSNFCGSQFWDTTYTWYTDYPQFTPCFEQTVLTWIPVAFLIVGSPFELKTVFQSRASHIPWNWRNVSKMGFNIIAIVAISADIVRATSLLVQGGSCFAVDVTTPVLRLLSLLYSSVLMHRHRVHGIRSSGLLFIFWLLVTVGGAFQLRREINKLKTGQLDLRIFSYVIYYFSCVAQLLLNFLVDSKPLFNSLEEEYLKPSPEIEASFPSRTLLTWFGKLTTLGYQRPLIDEDLWDLHRENTSSGLAPGFQNRLKNKQAKDAKTSIVPILVSTFGATFLKGAFLEFITCLLVFVNPQILKLLINFVTNGEEVWKGVLYAGLLLVTATFQTLITSEYLNIEALVSLRTTTVLTSSIYRKALTLSSTARKTSTIGEIVNLMSVDVHRVSYFAGYLNMIWSAPLEICLSIYFLWTVLGWSVLVGFAVMSLMVPISVFTAKCNKNIQKKYMNLKDRRIKLISEILAGIKVMKLYAWEPSFERMVLKIRRDEVQALKREAYFDALTTFVWTCAPYFVTLVSFTTYVLLGNALTAETAFVSLSLFNILRFPFDRLPWMLTSAVQCRVAVSRINKYLNEADLDEESVERISPVGTFIPSLSLSMTHATFAWDKNEPAILKDITLNVTSNSLIAVVGPVGSGKTSLISAFLGEMEKLSGHVHVLGSVAYAPQVPWVQNNTLKNNILFGKPLDEELYDKVLDACALKPDLDMLPGGDLTEIGEKGINLSGGQKQRISFARAVYSNADIYFLDDPMSAVDSHVGKQLFERVIGHGGLLNNKIRILVTHVVTFLPFVDSIVVLENGHVSEVGSYNELLERRGAFSKYLTCYAQESSAGMTQAQSDGKPKRSSDKRTRLISVTSKSSRVGRIDSWSLSSESSDGYGDADNRNLIEKEKAEIDGVKWSVYTHFFKSTGFYVLAAMLLFNLLAESLLICSNFWLSAWSTDSSLVVNGTVDVHKRDVYLGVYGALGLGLSATSIFAYLAPVLGTLYASIKLHERLLKRVMSAPMSFFDTVPSGRIVSRFSKDVDSLDSDLPHSISEFLFVFCEVLGIFVVITVTTPIFIVGIIPIGVVYYFIQRYFLATSRQLKRLESISRSPIYSHFSETIAGASVIRAYGFQPKFIKESEEKVDFNQKCSYYEIIANRWLGIRLEILGNFIIFFAALFVVYSRGSLSDGLTGLSLTYALEITEMLNWLVRSTAEVETNIVAVERIKQFEEISQESSSDILPPQNWPEIGEIEFKGLSLRYRDGLDLVLKDLTFRVKGGEKVGIVGRTGAGKSSLTLALFRIVESAQGEILIDGVDISKLHLHYLRSRITIIPQDPVLFSATIRVNLDPFEQYSDEQIWQALDSSHLKTFVSNLPFQLNHQVAEGGANFSAGQRQLICLARALLRKTKVLVLDEATAAVDLETDDFIQATIRSEFAFCTILTIAHRINTVIDSDRVLVLDEGTVCEYDNPSELLKDRQSIFYSLARDAGLAQS